MASKKKPSKNTVKKSIKTSPAAKKKAPARKPTASPAKRPQKIAKKQKPAKPVMPAMPKAGKRPLPPRPAATKLGKKAALATPPVAPVVILPPRNGKNAAGLSVKELSYFRDLLLMKRRELVGDVSSMEDEALRSSGQSNLSTLPIHMADMGTDNYEQEFTLGLVEKDRNLLRDIQAALAKIAAGTYGICEGTGKPIAKPRLEAQPWARFSIEHARTLEQRRMRA